MDSAIEFTNANHEDYKKTKYNLEFSFSREKLNLEGYTLIPLKIYFVKGRAKVLIGVCKGKKNYDKRESIKEKDLKRELSKNSKYR